MDNVYGMTLIRKHNCNLAKCEAEDGMDNRFHQSFDFL